MGRSPIGKRDGYQDLAKLAMRRAAHNAHSANEQESIWEIRIRELELNLFNVSRKYLRYIDQLHSRLLSQEKMMESQKEMNAVLLTTLSKADDRIKEHTQQLKAMTSIHQTYCRLFTSSSSEKPPFQSANNLLHFYERRPIDWFEDFPVSCANNKEKQVFCAPSPFPPNAHPDMPLNSEHTMVNDFVEGLWCNTDNYTDN